MEFKGQGQSHATVWAQVVADELGRRTALTSIVTSGDTRRFAWGSGDIACAEDVTARQRTASGGAHLTIRTRIDARDLEADAEDLELGEGHVRVKARLGARGRPLAAVAVGNPVERCGGPRERRGGNEFKSPARSRRAAMPEGEQLRTRAPRVASRPRGDTWAWVARVLHARRARREKDSFRLEILVLGVLWKATAGCA